MDNIIIGVLAREEQLNGTIYNVISRNSFKYLNGKCSFIGIINYEDNIDFNILELCDGIILTGGNKIYDYHFKIVEYCINKNIPILGICMGSQIIGLYSFNGSDYDLIKVNDHYKTNHNIKIDSKSVLFNILGDSLIVNSRHNYSLPNDKVTYRIGALDGSIIESIEDINNDHFLLGVEWHPEDMDNMESLYNYFLKEVIIRKKQREKEYFN